MTTVGVQLLDRLARFGPSFALSTHSPESAVAEPWQPFGALLSQPEVLHSRVAAVREALAQASGRLPEAVEQRVAASMTQLSLTARLMAPALAAAIDTGTLLRLDPARLRWQPDLGPGFPLSVSSDAVVGLGGTVNDIGTTGALAASDSACAAADTTEALAELLVGPVGALVRAFGRYSLSPQVLWGNVASAVNGTVSLLAAAEPSLAERGRLIASRLLEQPPLRGRSQGGSGRDFVRLSCCLIYRLAPARPRPVCGDCVLRP